MRRADTGFNPATGAFVAQIEATPKILTDAWDANKGTASTLYYFTKILEATAGAKYGPADSVSTLWNEGTYWANNVTSVTPDGEASVYTYIREAAPIAYRFPFSFWRSGIEFDKRQIDFLANAQNARYDMIQTEFNAKFKDMMNVQNLQMLGVAPHGLGTWDAINLNWGIFGLRTITNNANPYYSITPRPVTGELNCINVAGAVIPADGMYATFSNWQSLIRANNEPTPGLIIAPETSRQNFVAEMVNVYASGPGAGARVVAAQSGGDNSTDFRFRFDQVDFMEWGVNLSVIFEPNLPGAGAGAANNEFLLLNPSTWELIYIPDAYYSFDQFREGAQNNPNVFWSNIYLHWALHMKVPKSQGRFTTVTLPVI